MFDGKVIDDMYMLYCNDPMMQLNDIDLEDIIIDHGTESLLDSQPHSGNDSYSVKGEADGVVDTSHAKNEEGSSYSWFDDSNDMKIPNIDELLPNANDELLHKKIFGLTLSPTDNVIEYDILFGAIQSSADNDKVSNVSVDSIPTPAYNDNDDGTLQLGFIPLPNDRESHSEASYDSSTSCPSPKLKSLKRTRRKTPKMILFLRDLLDRNSPHIKWLNRYDKLFKLTNTEKIAYLWGLTKNKTNVKYPNMSRSLRNYAEQNLLHKSSKNLVFQFVD